MKKGIGIISCTGWYFIAALGVVMKVKGTTQASCY